jgi:low temperature requirement protein LtrA
MNGFGARRSILRARHNHQHHRVEFVELFFDLVFVFAVTQLSHGLLAHLDAQGAAHVSLLLVAVWWVWITASWMTNWLDPETQPVRLVLFAMMGIGLVLSSSIPGAFGSRAVPFAWAYVTLQVGRTLFVLWAFRHHWAAGARNFQRILAWVALAAVPWIAGAHGPAEHRFAVWALALCLEFGSPAWGFWTPGLGRSTTRDWAVEGGHMAERCGLFIIIALGESVIVTGSTFAGLLWNAEVVGAFVAAFAGTIAMWWIYFAIGAARGSRLITASDDPGRLAWVAYTVLHVPIVAGIVLAAVADELVLAHPAGHVDAPIALAVLGGPAIYVLGNALFKRTSWSHLPLSHLVGLALLAALATVATKITPLLLSAATAVVMLVVAAWEWRSLARPS